MEPPLIQLSQNHFKLLSLCPRKYQYTYWDKLLIPTTVAHRDEQENLGRQFHLLMQQYWMGLEIQPLLAASQLLTARFEAFRTHPPEMIPGDRFTEHRRMLKIGSYLLVGVFDLLVLNAEAGQIIDWKSYRKPKSSDHLHQSWQTQLYLYLLAETTELPPEQMSMTYWFAHTASPQESHSYTVQYSKSLHQDTHQRITRILAQLSQWRQDYASGQPLPQVTLAQGHCLSEQHQCPYLFRCERSPQQLQTSSLLDCEAIPEVPLATIQTARSEPR